MSNLNNIASKKKNRKSSFLLRDNEEYLLTEKRGIISEHYYGLVIVGVMAERETPLGREG